jgi:nucleotide-binding universal stress UspA family protein
MPAENVSIETEVFTGGVKQAIIDEAENFGADVIVVGSNGRGFWGRDFIGSTSDPVIHHAPCSILVVRKEVETVAKDR